MLNIITMGLLWWLKAIPCNARRRFNPWVRTIPWRREWLLTSVFLPGKFHGQRSLADYSPWIFEESDTSGCLSMHACIVTMMLKVDDLWFGALWARAAGIPIGQCTLIWRIQSQTVPWSWHNHTAGEVWGEGPMKDNGKDIPDKPGISCTMCYRFQWKTGMLASIWGSAIERMPLYKRMWPYPFSSVAQLRPTLCHPMNRSTPGLPVHP